MTAITVEHLSKVYHLYDSPQARLKEALHPLRRKYHHDFYALKDVSFSVEQGEVLGIIGKNGCGKSTLLKILAGVLTPTSGTVAVNGNVSALLELGGGFNPEFTGLENVYFSSAIMGYTREQVEKNLDNIIAFADIGEFIHQPVKTYSSGMYVRLAFAVAINVDPDVLIVDEALAVGDIRFQQKCFRKIREFQEHGKSIIFVTHDTGAVINFCNQAIWLDSGKIKHEGVPDETVKRYMAYMAYDAATEERKSNPTTENSIHPELQEHSALGVDDIQWQDVSSCSFFGEGGAKIDRVAFYTKKPFKKVNLLQGGERVIFFVNIDIKKDIFLPGIGIRLNDVYGNHIFSITSYVDEYNIKPLKEGDRIEVAIEFDFPKILNGEYAITTAISDGTQLSHIQHHWVHDAYTLHVVKNDLRHNLGYIVMDKADLKIKYFN